MFFGKGTSSMEVHKTENTIVLANWKANFAPQRAFKWCDEFIESYTPVPEIEVVVAVPFFCMREVAAKLSHLEGVELAAQSVSSYPQGSYSGANPASWLQGIAKYSLLGHRERRKYFHETHQDVAKQVRESLLEELQPIVCVDKDNVNAQVAVFDSEELMKIHWAYTPKDADHLEKAHSNESIEKAVESISGKVGRQNVLYGGGVNSQNGKGILELKNISGILMGRGCLDGKAFAELVSKGLG